MARNSGARTPSTTVRSGLSWATGTIRPEATIGAAEERAEGRVQSDPVGDHGTEGDEARRHQAGGADPRFAAGHPDGP